MEMKKETGTGNEMKDCDRRGGGVKTGEGRGDIGHVVLSRCRQFVCGRSDGSVGGSIGGSGTRCSHTVRQQMVFMKKKRQETENKNKKTNISLTKK